MDPSEGLDTLSHKLLLANLSAYWFLRMLFAYSTSCLSIRYHGNEHTAILAICIIFIITYHRGMYWTFAFPYIRKWYFNLLKTATDYADCADGNTLYVCEPSHSIVS